MSTSARRQRKRIIAMMASTVVLSFKWATPDPESARLMRKLAANTGLVMNILRDAIKRTQQTTGDTQ